jgi:hypothetical protein
MRSAAPATALIALAALVLAFVLGGCGADNDRPAATAPPAARTAPPVQRARVPALCARLQAAVVGQVASPAATELSGLVLSRTQRDVAWTHNDSGDSARLLAIRTSGRLLAEVAVAGAENVDWEDIAAGRGGALLVGDIGDNLAQRPTIAVYVVPEAHVTGTGAVAAASLTAAATRIELRYPDGPRDAEALLRDPTNDALVIVEKNYGAQAGVYVADQPTAGTTMTLRRSSTLKLGVGESITAGDVSADGRTIALRSYDHAFFWTRRDGESVAAALRRRPCSARANVLSEGQGESLALSRDGTAFFTVPEGPGPQIRRYSPSG